MEEEKMSKEEIREAVTVDGEPFVIADVPVLHYPLAKGDGSFDLAWVCPVCEVVVMAYRTEREGRWRVSCGMSEFEAKTRKASEIKWAEMKLRDVAEGHDCSFLLSRSGKL